MEFDVSQPIYDVDGTRIRVPDEKDAEAARESKRAQIVRLGTLRDILLASAMHVKYVPLGNGAQQEQLTPEEIGRRHEVIKKLKDANGKCDLTSEEITLLKQKLGESQHPWVAGEAIAMIK